MRKHVPFVAGTRRAELRAHFLIPDRSFLFAEFDASRGCETIVNERRRARLDDQWKYTRRRLCGKFFFLKVVNATSDYNGRVSVRFEYSSHRYDTRRRDASCRRTISRGISHARINDRSITYIVTRAIVSAQPTRVPWVLFYRFGDSNFSSDLKTIRFEILSDEREQKFHEKRDRFME